VLAQGQLVAQLRQKGQDGVVGHWTEGWDGYPAGRRRMLDAIAASGLSNPVFIGGDIHSFWTTDLKADFGNPASATIATEFVGTSITSGGPHYELLAQALPENPHVRFFESRHRGYVSVDVTPDRMEIRFQVISDRRDPNATLSTLKRFVVESGKPGAVRLTLQALAGLELKSETRGRSARDVAVHKHRSPTFPLTNDDPNRLIGSLPGEPLPLPQLTSLAADAHRGIAS
jgi:phosphodiesterase/alkaline phosphatase D-like protein